MSKHDVEPSAHPTDSAAAAVRSDRAPAHAGLAVKLQVLYFDGCPSHEQLMPTLCELAAAHDAELVPWRVETPEHAQQARFLGSPSVRVDGHDVEPGADTRTDYGLKCRLYRSSGGQSGLPPREWIEQALREKGAR